MQRRDEIVLVPCVAERKHLTALHSLADKLADKLCGEQTLADERTQTLALGLILRLAAEARGHNLESPMCATRDQLRALRAVLATATDPSLKSLKGALRA